MLPIDTGLIFRSLSFSSSSSSASPFTGELERKKRKVKDGHKDPVLAANSRLQEEINQQIQLLRKHAEKNSILLAEAQRRMRLANESASSVSADGEGAAGSSASRGAIDDDDDGEKMDDEDDGQRSRKVSRARQLKRG